MTIKHIILEDSNSTRTKWRSSFLVIFIFIIQFSCFWLFIPSPTGHYRDVGIECDTLLPFLENAVYWKGITFTPNNSSDEESRLYLENVLIAHAVQGITALKKAPELAKVTITDCVTGVLMKNLQNPLVIADTNILRCKTSGVNVTSLVGPVTIENVTVQNTSHGDGLVFRHNIDIMDFCSNISQLPSFPLVFNASGATFCSKVRGNVGVANFIIMNFWLALPSLLTQFEPQPPHSPLQNSSITSKPFKLGPPILATFPKIEKSSRRVRQHCC